VSAGAVRRCCRKHEAEDLNGSIFGRSFIVCPTCGDKRCAHAEDCDNACQQPARTDCYGAELPPIAESDGALYARVSQQPAQPGTLSEFVHAPEHVREQIGNDVARRVDARMAQPGSGEVLPDHELLDQFSAHPSWELSLDSDPPCGDSPDWLVHNCCGGRNDREWVLIGRGRTVRAAITAAIRRTA